MISEHNLIWIDLEMTGLDPEKNVILEIASVITDKDLAIVAKGPSLVIHHPDDVLKKMDPWSREQHTKSGLLQLVRESKITAPEAQDQILAFVRQFCKPEKSPLCGNSVWQDKNFLRTHMRELNDFLYYRIIDVTTVKELILRWYPHVPEYKKKDAHRALDDIKESIEELNHYRHHFFRQSAYEQETTCIK